MITELFKIWRHCNRINNSGTHFFFPFYHIGGAETVHLRILATFDEKPNCFITNQSFSDANKETFEKLSNLIEFDAVLNRKKYRDILLQKIAAKINKNRQPVVFGCNSIFFYDLIPFLKNHVRVFDLTHAFSYERYSPEVYSLPHVARLDSRVVLGSATKENYAALYRERGVSSFYNDRIKIIKNSVCVPQSVVKPENEVLQLIFVARNSPEKRPEIVFDILQQLNESNLRFHCKIVGDFNKEDVLKNTEITGEIDPELLSSLYAQSDVLLLTSEREGLPMVILEAMAHKVVPISTDVGEIRELLNAEPGIILIKEANPKQIASQIIQAIFRLDRNRTELRSRQENCYGMVKENYSVEQFTENYRQLFARQ